MNIDNYIQELITWNTTHNLISKNEIHNLQEHLDDSLSLCESINESPHNIIIDIGSGGGFPAIPLGFWLKDNNIKKKIIATDIVTKKLSFLKWCSIKFELNIDVQDLSQKFVYNQECIIISRAFASIKNILLWRDKHAPLAKNFLLLKGNTVEQELIEANINEYQLLKNPRGFIVKFDKEKL